MGVGVGIYGIPTSTINCLRDINLCNERLRHLISGFDATGEWGRGTAVTYSEIMFQVIGKNRPCNRQGEFRFWRYLLTIIAIDFGYGERGQDCGHSNPETVVCKVAAGANSRYPRLLMTEACGMSYNG